MKVPFRKTTADHIDFSDWNLPKLDEVRDGIREAFEEVILAACEEGANVYFPYIWSVVTDEDGVAHDGEGGEAVFDPLMIRISVPLGGNEDNMPSWDLDLAALIEDEISRLDGTWTDADLELLTRMRNRLAGLVELVEAQMAAHKKQ